LSQTSQQRERAKSGCVADLRELCVEFQRAIAALAADDVAAVETATAAQEQLAEKLQDWFRGLPSGERPSITISPGDFRELVNLTRVYSALLQRSLRSSRLRAALCETYRQAFPATRNESVATSWSCEV
jgi:hypothetical protein